MLKSYTFKVQVIVFSTCLLKSQQDCQFYGQTVQYKEVGNCEYCFVSAIMWNDRSATTRRLDIRPWFLTSKVAFKTILW